MADPLSLLRQFNINKKPVTERNSQIIFGEYSWPKSVKTNFLKYNCGKEDTAKEYYTLECLLFLMKNVHLAHSLYVKQAVTERIPVVRRPDRKELLAYLNGETENSSSIEKSALIETPIAVKRVYEEEKAQNVSKKPKLAAGLDALNVTPLTTENIRSLSESLSVEKIVELKGKCSARRRFVTKREEDVIVTRNIVKNERQGRTRTSILQSRGQNFANSLFPLLQRIKIKEESAAKSVQASTAPPGGHVSKPQPYHRYYQERFRGNEEIAGFKIDTMETFHGMTLEALKERAAPKKPVPQLLQPENKISSLVPARLNTKPVSKTPIIIVSASPTSLITMCNARDILQFLRYTKSVSVKRENELMIQRQKEGGTSGLYRVIDNPMKLRKEDWDRVVAVFVHGPAWQFKGWPWNPVEIFSRIRAFHLKWDDSKLHENIAMWNVHVIELNVNRRHTDRANLMLFWEELDKFMAKYKRNLTF